MNKIFYDEFFVTIRLDLILDTYKIVFSSLYIYPSIEKVIYTK